MSFLKKYGGLIIGLAMVSELVLPVVLSRFNPAYNPLSQLTSFLAEEGAPTENAYRIWSITNGVFIVLGTPGFYQRFAATSHQISMWLCRMLAVFALASCVLPWVIGRSSPTATTGAQIALSDYASSAGLLALLASLALLTRLYRLEKNPFMSTVLPLMLVIALVSTLLFAIPRIPIINQLHFPYRGLWQRGSLLFTQVPFVIVGIRSIRTRVTSVKDSTDE